MEHKKIDNDIEAKLAEASKAYEDWLTSVEQREEEEKYGLTIEPIYIKNVFGYQRYLLFLMFADWRRKKG